MMPGTMTYTIIQYNGYYTKNMWLHNPINEQSEWFILENHVTYSINMSMSFVENLSWCPDFQWLTGFH